MWVAETGRWELARLAETGRWELVRLAETGRWELVVAVVAVVLWCQSRRVEWRLCCCCCCCCS